MGNNTFKYGDIVVVICHMEDTFRQIGYVGVLGVVESSSGALFVSFPKRGLRAAIKRLFNKETEIVRAIYPYKLSNNILTPTI